MFRTSLYWDSHLTCICVYIEEDVCDVPMVDTLASGEVNCKNCIGRLYAQSPVLQKRSARDSNVLQLLMACEDNVFVNNWIEYCLLTLTFTNPFVLL